MRRLSAMLTVAALCGTVFSLAMPATAQEVMEFKPVPAESVSQSVRPGARKSEVPPATPRTPDVSGTAAVPPTPALPEPPEAPEAPEAVDQSGNMVRFGSNIHVREGQNVVGDVVAMGGDVTVDGHVEGDVVAMGGDVILGPTGRVDGQVVTLGGQLHEQPGSHVGGQRVTAGGLPHGWSRGPFLGVLGMVGSGIKAALAIATMFLALLVAWGFTQLAPHRTRTAYQAFKDEPLKCLGFGLLGWALIIPSIVALALVVAILCITIIGIPLAVAVLIGYAFALVLLVVWGYVVGAAVLGERLSRQMGRAASSLTLMAVWGIVALTVIRVVGHLFGGIPMGGAAGGMLRLLSAVMACVLTTMGAGALLTTQLRRDALTQWWPGSRAAVAVSTPPAPPESSYAPPVAAGELPAPPPPPPGA